MIPADDAGHFRGKEMNEWLRDERDNDLEAGCYQSVGAQEIQPSDPSNSFSTRRKQDVSCRSRPCSLSSSSLVRVFLSFFLFFHFVKN